jgi:hypothetical protein
MLSQAERTQELSNNSKSQVAFAITKAVVEMARMAEKFEKRTAKQELMYAQQNKMFERYIALMTAKIANISTGTNNLQHGQSGSGAEYEAGLRGGRVMKTSRKNRDSTRCREPETTGPREPIAQ